MWMPMPWDLREIAVESGWCVLSNQYWQELLNEGKPSIFNPVHQQNSHALSKAGGWEWSTWGATERSQSKTKWFVRGDLVSRQLSYSEVREWQQMQVYTIQRGNRKHILGTLSERQKLGKDKLAVYNPMQLNWPEKRERWSRAGMGTLWNHKPDVAQVGVMLLWES